MSPLEKWQTLLTTEPSPSYIGLFLIVYIHVSGVYLHMSKMSRQQNGASGHLGVTDGCEPPNIGASGTATNALMQWRH